MVNLILAYVLIMMLLCAALVDVAFRSIPNWICLGIAVVGATNQVLTGPMQLVESLAVAAILFFVLLALHSRRLLGGGDVKLLVAVSIGLSLTSVVYLFAITAVAGGVLAVIHLVLRHLPRPRLAPAKSSIVRRVYAAERWRILRKAPLPYGVAIACGGIVTLLYNTGV
jgi:prepilin peptidase CpaA